MSPDLSIFCNNSHKSPLRPGVSSGCRCDEARNSFAFDPPPGTGRNLLVRMGPVSASSAPYGSGHTPASTLASSSALTTRPASSKPSS
jgi:hypothetical protein